MKYIIDIMAAIIVPGRKEIRVEADNDAEAEKRAIEIALDDGQSDSWRPDVWDAANRPKTTLLYPLHACPKPQLHVTSMHRDGQLTPPQWPWSRKS